MQGKKKAKKENARKKENKGEGKLREGKRGAHVEVPTTW